MNIVIALCLLFMLIVLCTTVIKLCVLNRSDKLSYLRNFRKGKVALIYIAAVPLYWLGIAYNGTPIGGAFLLAVKASIELVVLKYDYNSVARLIADNQFFCATIIICFVLVALNVLLFTFTLIGQSVSNYFRRIKTVKLSKKIYVVVGFNQHTKSVIRSITAENGRVLLLYGAVDSVADFAFIEKVAALKLKKEEDLGSVLTKLFKRFDDKTVHVIVNTGKDAANLICAEQVCSVVLSHKLCELSIDGTKGLNAFVFGEPENTSAFLHFVEKSNGCIHYVNKYKLIAMDFVGKYPITQFMNEEQIDYNTATVRDDVAMNVVLIGFGKTNQQIFLTAVANNQMLTSTDGKLTEASMDYWIYDKVDSRNDKNLNHNYYRYANEVDGDATKYLPLPPNPARTTFFELAINDTKFYDSIRHNLSASQGKTPYNYIVIAFGSDLENLDFADKITAKLREWELLGATKVFVKIRDDALTSNVVDKEYAAENGFITFGNEKEVVYNVAQIIGERKEVMARDRHLCYSIKDGMSEEDEAAAKAVALRKWYQWSQVQRESNIYACLSIRLKLHLLGFDYRPTHGTEESANTEYQSRYECGDPIRYDDSQKTVKGKRTIVYSNDYVLGSVRQTFAVQEHQRWNAYMISCGMIPSTREQIATEGSKNFDLRRHGNITTFDGLIEYRKIVADKNGCSEEETDVIRYDYQIMDDLVWLLTQNGYTIAKRGA